MTSDSKLSILDELKNLRWRVLPLIMTVTFGSYYIYDFPGAIGIGSGKKSPTIQSKFTAAGYEYTETMNLALYSVYNYPNMVLALFGGVLIDRIFGIRKATLLFTGLIMAGAFIFWVGVVYFSYPAMIAGRFIFGLGGESQSVAQSAYTTRWFKMSPALSLAFGICLSFSRVGSSFNFLFMPGFSTSYGLDFAVFTGCIACTFSMLSAILLVILDKRAEKRGEIVIQDPEGDFECKSVVAFPLSMWLIAFICITAYMAIFPFNSIAVNLFEQKFGYESDEAARTVSIYQFVSAGASPVLGFLVDRSGRFVFWTTTACAMICLFHIALIITSIPPSAMMAWLGLSYSMMASSLWPGVAYVVPASGVGTAYGLMTALQNFGSGTMPLIAGVLLDANTPAKSNLPRCNTTNTTNETYYTSPYFASTTQYEFTANGAFTAIGNASANCTTHKVPDPLPSMHGFDLALMLFAGTAAVAVLLCLWNYFVDKSNTGMLNATPAEREAYKQDPERKRILNDADPRAPMSGSEQYWPN